MDQVLLRINFQADAGAIEKPAFSIEPGRPHRVVMGVNLIAQRQCFARAAVDFPSAFVKLGHNQFCPALQSSQTLQIF